MSDTYRCKKGNRSNTDASMIQESLKFSDLSMTIEGCKNRHNVRNRMWKKHRIHQEKLFSSLETYTTAQGENKDRIEVQVTQILATTISNLKNLESMYYDEYCVDYLHHGPKSTSQSRKYIMDQCRKSQFNFGSMFE